MFLCPDNVSCSTGLQAYPSIANQIMQYPDGRKIGSFLKNVYLPSLRVKVPDHVYVFGSLLLQ
jgi:hypothetical protein